MEPVSERTEKPRSFGLYFGPCGKGANDGLEGFSRLIQNHGLDEKMSEIFPPSQGGFGMSSGEKLRRRFPDVARLGVGPEDTLREALEKLGKKTAFYSAATGNSAPFAKILGVLEQLAERKNVVNRGCLGIGSQKLHRMDNEAQAKFLGNLFEETQERGETPILIGEGHYLSTPHKRLPKGAKLVVFDRHFDTLRYKPYRDTLSHANFLQKIIIDGLVDPKDIVIIGPHPKAAPWLGFEDEYMSGEIAKTTRFYTQEVEEALDALEKGGQPEGEKAKKFLEFLGELSESPVHLSFDIDSVRDMEGHDFPDEKWNAKLFSLDSACRALKHILSRAKSLLRADFLEYNAALDPEGRGAEKLGRLVETVLDHAEKTGG